MLLELIYRHDAYEILMHEADRHSLHASKEAYKRSAIIVDKIKPVDFVRYGRWVFTDITAYCSECGSVFDISEVGGWRGCPYCLSVLIRSK